MPKPDSRRIGETGGLSGIRLAALDFDGTLVPKDVPNVDLNDQTAALLEQLRCRGLRLIVATGRHPSFIQKRIRKFQFDAVIGYSGNVSHGRQKEAAAFRLDMIQAVYVFAQNNPGLEMTLYSDHGIACGSSSESREALLKKWRRTDRICDLNGVADFLISDIRKATTMQISRICLHLDRWELYPGIKSEFQIHFPGYRLVKTGDKQAEVLAQGRSKASEILRLAHSLGISADQIACAGDDENDIEMLQLFDHSYYIGRNDDPLRSAAAYCAGHVDTVLEQLLIKGESHV